jgi:hypothetical protein
MSLNKKFSSMENNFSTKTNLSSNIFSWKESKATPFELFKSEYLFPQFLFNKINIELKSDWAYEYEIIYNSQIMET